MTQSTDIRPLLEQAAACIQILKQEWPDTPATVLLSAELALAQGLHPNDQRLEALAQPGSPVLLQARHLLKRLNAAPSN